jgi:hypothetical protein
VGPNWSQVLSQLIGTSGKARSGEGKNGPGRETYDVSTREHDEDSFRVSVAQDHLELDGNSRSSLGSALWHSPQRNICCAPSMLHASFGNAARACFGYCLLALIDAELGGP